MSQENTFRSFDGLERGTPVISLTKTRKDEGSHPCTLFKEPLVWEFYFSTRTHYSLFQSNKKPQYFSERVKQVTMIT